MKYHKLTGYDILFSKLNILEESHQQLDTEIFTSFTKYNQVDIGEHLSERA